MADFPEHIERQVVRIKRIILDTFTAVEQILLFGAWARFSSAQDRAEPPPSPETPLEFLVIITRKKDAKYAEMLAEVDRIARDEIGQVKTHHFSFKLLNRFHIIIS